MSCLFGQLGSLNDALDHFLLLPSLLVVTPPHRALVFALQSQMSASFAAGFALIAFLPSQSACEAACALVVSSVLGANPCMLSQEQPTCSRPSVHFGGRLLGGSGRVRRRHVCSRFARGRCFRRGHRKILVQISGRQSTKQLSGATNRDRQKERQRESRDQGQY